MASDKSLAAEIEAVRVPDVYGFGRRWKIRQYRITQPRAELERKARKSRGRHSRYTVEDSDLHGHAMAITDLRIEAMFPTDKMPVTFCSNCHAFSTPGVPVTEHKHGCAYGPARRAEREWYRRRLGKCADFQRWPLPAPYSGPSAALAPNTTEGRTDRA